jgi:hypothetical protein
VDADHVGNGVVSNTEFAYLNGVTSSIQTQLNAIAAGSWQSGITTSGSGVSGSNLQYLVQFGLVFLRGSISTSSRFRNDDVIGSLPTAARPTTNVRLMLATDANSYAFAVTQFKTNGDIKIPLIGGNQANEIWIDGVVFHKT